MRRPPTRPQLTNLLATTFVGILLIGCAVLPQLSTNDAAYFRQKTNTALGTTNSIQELYLFYQNGKSIAIITLLIGQENAEQQCLKVMRALSNDSLVPSVDEVNVKAQCANGTIYSKQTVGGPVPMKNSRGVTTMMDVSVPITTGSEKVFKTVYSCVATRDSLLKGDNPTVVIQNGVFVSGPYKGKSAL